MHHQMPGPNIGSAACAEDCRDVWRRVSAPALIVVGTRPSAPPPELDDGGPGGI